MATSTVLVDNPYVGPEPFEEKHQAVFFGRTREANDVYSLIVAHAEVLLYAQSGAGKTSLLNAGLIPRLKTKGFQVYPPARVARPLPDGAKSEDVANLYMFNALRTLSDCRSDWKTLAGKSLSDFLGLPEKATENADNLEESGEPGSPKPVESAPTSPEGQDTARRAPHVVLVFDQLEEIFEYYSERRGDRKRFFQQVGEALDRDAHLRVVFAIREDYLAQLIPYLSLLPEGMKTRFRLERLQQPNALAAVKKPLELAQPRRTFADGAADALVQELLKIRVINAEGEQVEVAGDYVEPVQLQVVCHELWSDLPPDAREITEEHLRAFGDVNAALSEFYEKSIEVAAEKTGVSEGQLRQWFEKSLITSAGTRGTLFRGAGTTGGIPNDAVDILVSEHVVRCDSRAGAAWCELTHDRFIDPILRSNARWRDARGSADLLRKQLEARAAEWDRRGRTTAGLLNETELAQANRWRHSPDAAEIGYSDDLGAFIHASAAEVQRAKDRLRRRLTVAAVILALVAIFAGWLAHRNYREATGEKQLETAHEMISASESNLGTDPEFSLLLALRADSALSPMLSRKYPADLQSEVRELRSESYDALNRAVQTSWVRRTIRGVGEAGVWGVSFTPDGTRMAAAEPGGTVRVWDVSSNRELASFAGEGSEVAVTALSPDGKFLATADVARRLRVWVLSSRNPIPLPPMQEGASTVTFSEDGMLLAVGGVGGTVTVYDGTSGKAIFNQHAHQSRVTALAFSRDGAHLATGSYDSDAAHLAAQSLDNTAKVWEIKTGRLLQTFSGHALGVLAVAFNPQGTRLATASSDRTIKVWDVTSGAPIETLSERGNDVVRVCFGPRGERLATGDQDGRVTLWDVETGNQLLTLMGHKGAVQSIAFNREGTLLTTASSDRTVRFWNVPRVHSKAVEDVAMSGDGSQVASVSLDATAKLWDSDGDEVLRTLSAGAPQPLFAAAGRVGQPRQSDPKFAGAAEPLYAVALSHDGRLLATNDFMGEITIYNTATGAPEGTPISGSSSGLSFSPDDRRLASGGPGNTAVVWDVSSGRALFSLSKDVKGVNYTYRGGVNHVAFSPDGKLLATAGYDWTARIWDAASGKQLYMLSAADPRYFRHLHSYVIWVSFSPDGQRLAIAPNDKTALIWDFKSEHLLPLTGHTNTLEGIAFSRDGMRVATASLDRTARVWDARTGKELFEFSHPAGVEQVAFSPDGKRLATACDDGMVRVFFLDEAELLSRARRGITRPWTDGECLEYLHQKCPRELATELSANPTGAPQR